VQPYTQGADTSTHVSEGVTVEGETAVIHLDGGTEETAATDADIIDAWRENCPELQTLWPDDADFSTLEGVTFDDDGNGTRVLSLDLSADYGLTGDVPEGLGQLTALTELGLHGNKFANFAADLGGLASLETLYLTDFAPG
jgi:Leucine-rich repeat (LRR) protein